MQIIDPSVAEKKGSVDTAATIQSSSIAAGSVQITNAISSSFVTNGGPGAQTVSLRCGRSCPTVGATFRSQRR